MDVHTAVAVAELITLKHRENRNLHQRIIAFVPSPLDGPGADDQPLEMAKLAKS